MRKKYWMSTQEVFKKKIQMYICLMQCYIGMRQN